MDVNKAEKEYRWLDAAKSYQELLSSKQADPMFAAKSWQEIGFCYVLASNQAKDTKEFKELRRMAIEAYETAAEIFANGSTSDRQGKSASCHSTAEYARSWLESNCDEKEKDLDKCHSFGKQALELFKKANDEKSYGRTCNVLSRCLFDRLYLTSVEDEKKEFAQEGIELSMEAISIFEKLEERE